MVDTLMPPKIQLGSLSPLSMGHAVMNWKEPMSANPDKGLRRVMGFILPSWQRPLVWTQEQSESFLRSVWLGLPIGTYSYNQTHETPELDGLLIDGQQRLWAIQQYLEDAFPVFGYRWSEVTVVDQRRFKTSTTFGCYVTESDDEQYLKDYYNRMNFGGTAHSEEHRA